MTGRWMLLGAAVLLVGCHSPEEGRVRGSAGADPGNRDRVVEMHGGSEIYYETPCRTTLDECTGPMPVSGLQ